MAEPALPGICPDASMLRCGVPGADVDDIYAAIRDLPVSERLKLVERVVHDLIDAETAPSQELVTRLD